METDGKKREVSRRDFFKVLGTVVAGGSIIGGTGALLHRSSLPRSGRASGIGGALIEGEEFASPYKLVSSFAVQGRIDAFEIFDGGVVVAAREQLLIYDRSGGIVNSFGVAGNLRDLAFDSGLIYALFPARVEVYGLDGELVRGFEACSEESDYCSLAVASGAVFVTDVANKNICKYTSEGNFERFINSPNGFVIPSYSFDITAAEGMIYCSNSGRHLVESYTLDGEYRGSFGKAGGAEGYFGGCCNPARLSFTSGGDIITSEKGNARISCYGGDGTFRSLLLDSDLLGGGIAPYDVKASGEKLFVAGRGLVCTYQYDKALAVGSACATCRANCPLQKGILI